MDLYFFLQYFIICSISEYEIMVYQKQIYSCSWENKQELKTKQAHGFIIPWTTFILTLQRKHKDLFETGNVSVSSEKNKEYYSFKNK